jgi:cytochrome b subunit of formate dehydrogenase
MVLLSHNDVAIYTNASTDPYHQSVQVYPIKSVIQSTLTSVIGGIIMMLDIYLRFLAVVEMLAVLVAFVNGSKESIHPNKWYSS